MGLVIRQSIFTTIISYAGAVIGYINLLYLYPKFLAPEQIGLLRAVQDAAILFVPFAQFGLAQSVFRFYPQLVKDKKSEASFVSLLLLLAIAGFGLFLIIFKIFEQPLLSYFEANAKEIIQYSYLVLWLTFILLLTAMLEAYSRSLLRTVFPNLLKEVIIRLLLAVLVVMYFQGWLTFNAFIIATVVAYLSCLVIFILYLVYQKSLSLSLNFSSLPTGKAKELIGYSLFSFAGTAAMVIIGKIDSMMVSALLGLAANAVYTTAFYMAAVIEIPKRALTQVAMPLIARAFEKKDMKDIATIYQKTSINQFIFGALFLIGIYINIDNIFGLMPKKEIYEAGKWVVIIIGVGKLTDMLFGPSSEIIVLSKYYWFNIILLSVLAAIVIVANNLLIPIYGINGAAMGAALALISFNTIKYFFILLKLKMQPFNAASVKVLFIAIAALLVNLIIPKFSNIFADIIVRSGIITLLYGGLILVSKSSPDGNDFLKKMFKQYGGFLRK
ncbi:MAG TPA: oligosaccharide flippase family protein [Cyclobacteriaceae bacterium]